MSKEIIEMYEYRLEDVRVMSDDFAKRELVAIMKTMGIEQLEFDWKICMESDSDEVEFIPIVDEERTIYRLVSKEETKQKAS